MSYNPTYNWSDIAGSLDDSVNSVTANDSVSAIVVTLLIILAIVVIAKRVLR